MYQNTQKLVKMAQVEVPSEFFPLRRFFLKNKTISDFLIRRFFNVLFIS
jgi:hypothetical protein